MPGVVTGLGLPEVVSALVVAAAAVGVGILAARTRRALRRVSAALDGLREQGRAHERSLRELSAGLDALAADTRGHRTASTEALARLETQQGEHRSEVHRLHADTRSAAQQHFRQVEALLGLHRLFPARGGLPPSRGWAASPDVLHLLATLVLRRRPQLVVELGSGLSTIWLGYAMEQTGAGGRIVSLDHDGDYAARTRELLAAHGLAAVAEVRHAPLVTVDLAGERWRWYDPESVTDLHGCGILFVDGPPAATQQQARYPALALLEQRLAAQAAVVVDDCGRPDEQEIVARWAREYPEWRLERLDHEKGTALLTR